MRVIQVVEGNPFDLDEGLRQPLRNAWRRLLERGVGSTTAEFEESAGRFTLRGLIGSIAVQSGLVIDIEPKVEPGDDWINAVLDLLIAPDRIDIAGNRRSGLAPRRNLLDVLATIYGERLERALRREGPILVLERQEDELGILKGKLDVSKWAVHASWRPHRFPVAYQVLTSDNEFTRTLAHVAAMLAPAAPTPAVRGSLLRSGRMLRPGAPELPPALPHAALRRLPAQWGAYEPAWDVAASVLSRRALLSRIGARHGVSLVIEAWPLLERLLDRALDAAVRLAGETGTVLTSTGKTGSRLLTPETHGIKSRNVYPDARLLRGTRHVATFEAKYARFSLPKGPPREHVFQAVATAAAADSPHAVLVYPDQFDPVTWRVHGLGDTPARLTAIGLGMFSYRRGDGDFTRGERLLRLLALGAAGIGDAAEAGS